MGWGNGTLLALKMEAATWHGLRQLLGAESGPSLTASKGRTAALQSQELN